MPCSACARPVFTDEGPICQRCWAEGGRRLAHLMWLALLVERWTPPKPKLFDALGGRL